MHSGKRPISAEHYVLLGLVIGHAGHHDLAVGGQVFGRLGHLRSPLSHLLGLLLRTIIHRQLVTGVEQPLGHMTAHVTHADEANAWFQMVAFHTHRNTSLSLEMLSYDPLRHPPANLLSYKDEVRRESGVSHHMDVKPLMGHSLQAAWLWMREHVVGGRQGPVGSGPRSSRLPRLIDVPQFC